MLHSFLKIVDAINEWVGRITAYTVLPMLGVSMYEVIARYVFKSPTMWAGQIISLLFVILVVPAGGYILLKDEHVRMDVLYSKWSPRGKAIIDSLTYVVFLAFIMMLSWKALEMAWTSVSIRESSWAAFHGPIYPKKIALALGAVLLLLQSIAQFLRNIMLIKESDSVEKGKL
jgi:TRAP-type mannitol/chloroaromatic compound transport system permease small subunit